MTTMPRYKRTEVLALSTGESFPGGTASVHLLQGHPAGVKGRFVYKEYKPDYLKTIGPEFIRLTSESLRLLRDLPNADARRVFSDTVNIPQAMVTATAPETGRLAPTGMIFPHVPDRFLFRRGIRKKMGRLPQSIIVGKVPEEYQEQLGPILNRSDEISGAGIWGFLESLAFAIHVMHELRTFHGDLSGTNVYFGIPTPHDVRTRSYVIDAFNGFHRVGGRRFDLISTLGDPWSWAQYDKELPHPHRIDIYQLCAWAVMAVSERTYWDSDRGQGDGEHFKERALHAGEDILTHVDSTSALLSDDPGSRVLHRDTAKAIQAGLGPIDDRPTATEIYKLFHQEFVDARRREAAV